MMFQRQGKKKQYRAKLEKMFMSNPRKLRTTSTLEIEACKSICKKYNR